MRPCFSFHWTAGACSPSVSRREGALSVVLSTANRWMACCASSDRCVCVSRCPAILGMACFFHINQASSEGSRPRADQHSIFSYQPSMSVLLFLSRKEDRMGILARGRQHD